MLLLKQDWMNNELVLTKKDSQRVGATNQLVEHVAVDSFDSVDQFAIILVGQPLIKQFTASQFAYAERRQGDSG